ncbi:circadian locomoter output cycles protein kaput [Tetranychus urticae]|uniref:Aryl hydrocarbon receptor n=1 Tax=Tetranychus urticae TaxID=32264 RepID=T1JYU4_TETUR|nr:circadian locomoter output cycles protein kaput [Tetranychus urticae]
MNHLGTMYATKRRRRNSKSVRVQPKEGQTKSNPSKRHRERLNAELDMLASLLPYEQSVLSKLDKLSILRLSVSYLRTKSYFQAIFNKERERQGNLHEIHRNTPRELLYPDIMMEGDLILQALNGFLLILTCDGEVFYTSHTVETYLGFHQSDICHQSVYELVHSEDREELQRHLIWNSHLPNERANTSLQEAFLQENLQYLERNFTVRFRCLLDNTSGFMRLDIRGRIKVLHGQNHKTESPPLALFAVCTPFGPPSLLEMPQKDSMFKSKHKLDLSLVSMDQRGKQLLGYSDTEMSNKGVYDLVHFDDLAYVASAHQELLKTGASGLIAYRLISKDNKWQWLQTSARLVYKNSKPDFILCTHKPLMEEEGRDLLGKRTMDFKVTYLDGGLGAINDRSGFLSDSDFVLRCQRNRRYKSQIRDLITNCRSNSKRKSLTGSDEGGGVYTPPFSELSPTGAMSAAAAAAAQAANAAAAAAAAHAAATNPSVYPNHHPHAHTHHHPHHHPHHPHHSHPHHHHPHHPHHHPGSGPVSSPVYPYSHATENMNLSTAAAAAAYGMPQNLFTAAAAIDHNPRSFLAPDSFLHYSRHALTTYYPDYHSAAAVAAAQYPTNGFLDHRSTGRSTFDCQLTPPNEIKYASSDSMGNSSSTRSSIGNKSCCDSYLSSSGANSSTGLMGHGSASAMAVAVAASSIQPLLSSVPNENGNKLSPELTCHRSNSFGFGLPSNSSSSSSTSSNTDCISVIKHKNSLPHPLSNTNLNGSPPSSSMETGSGSTASTPSIPGSAFTSASPLNHPVNSSMNADQSRSSVLMWNRTCNTTTTTTTTSSSSSSSSPTINHNSNNNNSSNNNNNNGNKYSSSSISESLLIHKSSSPVVSCKWNGSISNIKPLSPHHPSMAVSPSSGKVPMSMSTYGSGSLYGSTDINPIEGWSVENIGHWRSHLPTLG